MTTRVESPARDGRAFVSAWRRQLLSNPLRLLALASGVLVALLVAYPLLTVMWRTLGPGSQPIVWEGVGSRLVPVLGNTALVVLSSAAAAMVVGTLLAWLHERTNANLGWVGELLPISMLLVPPIAGVVGWIVLFDPRVGYGNAAIRWLLSPFGIDPEIGPIDIYSVPMVIVVCTVYLIPYVFLLLTSAFQVLDSSAEEAARVNGASAVTTFFRITLPSIAPALAGAAIIAIIRGLVTFAIIAVLGTAANLSTIVVYIYQLMNSFPQPTGLALILAIGMAVFIQLLLLIQTRVVRPDRYATIGGRGGSVRRTDLGPMRIPLKGGLVGYLIITSVLPALALIMLSFQQSWSSTIQWGAMTLDNYAGLFAYGTTARAIGNSLLLGVLGATIVMVIGALLVLGLQGSGRVARRVSAFLMNLPATIPHTLVGIAFIVAFAGPPWFLYGSLALLLLAYIAMELPYAHQAAQSAASSVGDELREASRVSGAGELLTLVRIQFPLMLPGLAAGWIIAFVHLISEVTASILLAGLGNPVIGPKLIDLISNGTYSQMSALAVIIMVVSSVLVIAMLMLRRFAARRLTGGRERIVVETRAGGPA